MAAPKVFYGVKGTNVEDDKLFDVTELVVANYLDSGNKLFIPAGDHARAEILGDPKFGVSKSIFINEIEYPHDVDVLITDFIPSKPAKELIKQINKK